MDHVYRLADAGVSYVWQEDHLACFPSYRFCDAIYGISSVLDDKYIFCGAADAIGDECPHIIDIHLRLPSEPFFRIALALLFQIALILHDCSRCVSIAAVVDVDVGGV